MTKKTVYYLILCMFLGLVASCSSGEKIDVLPPQEDGYLLKKEDINVDIPPTGLSAVVGDEFTLKVNSLSDSGVKYEWYLDDNEIASTKDLNYVFLEIGVFQLKLVASQNSVSYEYTFEVAVATDTDVENPEEGSTAYITKVLDFMPAVGQFTNELPKYVEGDTQESMNQKVLDAIGNNNKGMISLGGYGGYVVVGFDHTIKNIEGQRDFRVLGNAFYAAGNPDPNAPIGGSCEPGIIMVAYDSNGNGLPDEHEWYEIAGSSHKDVSQELFYQKGVAAKNDMNFYSDYEITYYKPQSEPTTAEDKLAYIKWEDNKGNSGYKEKNAFHNQPYFPQWFTGDKLTFKGSRLPENGIDESGAGNYFVLYKFLYGYADNEQNTKPDSAIDIDWAVNTKGEKVNLPGIDFVKIYTGVNQENGWLGENSTEITGVEDLHLLKEVIPTR